MNVLDVLNEYRAYLKTLARRPNGREKDVEKAKIIIAALEKQIPKKPKDIEPDYEDYGRCPCCDANVDRYDDGCICECCGQALDWSDTE